MSAMTVLRRAGAFGAIAAALAAAPAAAQTAHVGVLYTNNDDGDTDVYGAEGAASFDLGAALGGQVDGALGSIDIGGDSAFGWRLNGHLFYTMDAVRIGGVFGGYSSEFDGSSTIDGSHFGVEGQYWFSRASLGASAIWGSADNVISTELDYNNFDFSADFYPTDNFVLGVNYGVGSVENAVGNEADTTSYGFDGEWQFASHPISLLAGYQHYELDDTPIETEAWTIGARWNWGGSLMERDRAGFRSSPAGAPERFIGF
jgi:hypothetical protein